MALTYDEFKKIVPKETVDFFNVLLPYLERYIGCGIDLYFNGTSYCAEDNGSKSYYLAVYALNSLKEYMAFLGENGFQKKAYKIEPSSTNNEPSLEFLYEKYNYLIPQYEDKTLYYGLQPLDIIIDLQNKHGNILNSYIFSTVFTQTSMSAFKKKLQTTIETKQQIKEKEIEKEIYTQVPISVVSYIETASKIRRILYNKLSYNKDSICKLIDEDIVPLSLFIALFINSNNYNSQNQNSFNNQEALMCLFLEKGIDLNKIRSVLNISFEESEIRNTSKNMYAIRELYHKYYSNGNDINMNPTKVSIQGIVKSILDRGFTNSLVIEKLLSKFNCNVEMFKNIEQETIRALENKKKTEEQETIKNFYKEVPKKTRDFIEFAGKTYSLLLDKMSEKKHNDKILATNNDAAVLALYIASHFFNGKISTFFNNSGASYEKILRLLKITITKEEIESKPVNRNTLVEQYKKYVYEGQNSGKSSNSISIDDICFNMCKRDFTKTMILENIYNSLIPEVELTNNFLPLMIEYFTIKEKQLKLEKTQKLFYDMPVESIKIVEQASIIYPKIIKSSQGLDKRGAQAISILLSILKSDNEETKNFLINQGFDTKKICEYFSLDSRYVLHGNVDIDLLSKDYGLLMFGLANKDKKREELTPFNLIRNIFTKEFNNSNVAFNKFLDEFKLSYDTFKNLDLLYQEYLDKLEKESIFKKVNDDMESYPNETYSYIKNVLSIHEKLKNSPTSNTLNKDNEIESISLLLGIYTIDNKAKTILTRNGLSQNNLLSLLKLPDDFLDNLDDVKIDYDTYLETYKKYISFSTNTYSIYIDYAFKELFKDNKVIKDIIDKNGCNYVRIKREVETGQSYEETLTVDDRIESLKTLEVEVIPQDNMKGILEFGNSLIPHSKYIHDALPSVSDNGMEESITKITGIIDEIYIPTTSSSKKAGLLTRVFNSDEVKYTIDKSKLYSLESTIEDKIYQLKKELLRYDEIRRYIETYSKKNREYLEVATKAEEEITQRLSEIDSSDEEQYSNYLTTSSFLHIINDKANRFATVNLLMRKELLKVNQAIVNHFITINSLEMAKNDLLPLIESELAIAQGRKTENQALELTKNIISLFQALLTRNVDTAIENMNKLQNTCIPEEVVTSINRDINTYIQGVTQVKALEGKIQGMEEKGKVLEKKPKKD